MGKSENFKINKGIASYGIGDHYAVLGLPLTTDAAQIRKKFLKLAKILHPDVFGRTPEEKEMATKYFSKMVSPAYQLLNNDRERGEYLATLRMFAQSQKQKQETPTLSNDIAQKLYRIPHEITYKQFIEQISPKQYESLESILEYTATLSELNLVYLLTQNNLSFTSGSSSAFSGGGGGDSGSFSSQSPARPATAPSSGNSASFTPSKVVVQSAPSSGNGQKLNSNDFFSSFGA